MDKNIHVLLLGGGTGGHIYPLVAVADALKEAAAQKQLPLELRYFGDPGGYAQYLREKGIRVSYIASSKLRRYASALNVLDFFKFFFGFFQALFKLYFYMPEVVFSKSGPGVLPIVYAARWYRIPIVIHESDSIPGLTNRVSAKHAKIVEVAFEHAKKYFVNNTVVNVVGTPVRASVIARTSPAECRRIFGLADDRPILFIVGGSQGAQILNEFVLTNAEPLLAQFEIIHQTGADNYKDHVAEFAFVSKNFAPELVSRYRPYPFLDEQQMAAAFGAADVILSRSGSSVFEIAANGKPAILIPLSSSANSHQMENAYAYSQTGAGIVVEESNMLPGLVFTQIFKIIDNQELRERMSAAARAFYKPNAASDIARDVLATAGVAA